LSPSLGRSGGKAVGEEGIVGESPADSDDGRLSAVQGGKGRKGAGKKLVLCISKGRKDTSGKGATLLENN